jgi:hypothetical protein
MTQLIQSPVVFNEAEHTYTINGRQLSGITSRLAQSIFFKDKYKGIPKSILNAKASYGSFIHDLFDKYNKGEEVMQSAEVISYIHFLHENKITPLESEYLISDNKHYATMIDLVDDEANLYDHKTTAKLDIEYLSWQLSINKYLMQKQTGIIANKLFVNHIVDKKCKLIEIPEKTFEDVYDMLYTDKYMYKEEQTEMPIATDYPILASTEVSKLSEIENNIFNMEIALEQAKKQKEEFIEMAKANMDKYGIEKWETDSFTITRTKDYTKETVDGKALKEKYPEIAKEFSKTSKVKGSIKIKLKSNELPN